MGAMKTTVELPDELVTEIKIEAARQKKKLKELVPELVRAGLSAQRAVASPDPQASARWLEEWVTLGATATRGRPPRPTATEILAGDRDRLERR
jgi:hypothetical protein